MICNLTLASFLRVVCEMSLMKNDDEVTHLNENRRWTRTRSSMCSLRGKQFVSWTEQNFPPISYARRLKLNVEPRPVSVYTYLCYLLGTGSGKNNDFVGISHPPGTKEWSNALI